jgi:nitrogen fixation/metabolism regulation signal transduction histidine kinase
MESPVEFQDNEDLTFFGKVNASISHELKNILAIISETAGLLGDLTQKALSDGKIDLELINTCSNDIVEEIQRGFATIKHMNRFAHSVDQTIDSVDLIDVLKLMINLSEFLSFASKVRFDATDQTDLTIRTCPFRLQNLIYQTLVFAYESVGPDGEIRVSMQRQPNGDAQFTFSGLGSRSTRPFPADETKKIAASIGAEIQAAGDSAAIHIRLPQLEEKSAR